MHSLIIPLSSEGPPLYSQIYRHIVEEIQRGRIKVDERMPSKRALCSQLGVSQSTVEAAYGMLCAEGYLEARPRSGYFVRDVPPLPQGPGRRVDARPAEPAAPPPRPGLDFSTGAVDTGPFPYATWAKTMRETLYQCPDLLQRGDGQGEPGLRRALSRFLYQYRGVQCHSGQIVIGAGVEYLLDLLLSLLPGDTVVALEDPGYPVAWHTALGRGLRVRAMAVEAEGMSLSALEGSDATVAYVTPSHQFPMGVTMPAGQRSRLLMWAAAAPERYIIEDDYDSEFRYGSRPIPSLQGMDQSGRVVYLGTFSRGLAPSIRVAYMVLPDGLLARYRQRKTFVSSTVSRLEQEALRRFLEGGHYTRHLRRMNNIYRQKRDALVARLEAIPAGQVGGQQAGLHFLFTLPGLSEQAMLALAEARGIQLRGLSRYRHTLETPASTVVLGFAGLPLDRVAQAADRLAQAWAAQP